MFELPAPEPLPGRHLSPETNPKSLKAWLISLPPANVLETGRAIYDALSTLNRTKIDSDNRLKLLEHYQISIDMLDAPLEASYLSGSAPIRDKAKQAAALARNLQLELLNGYKLILNERINVRFSLSPRHIPEQIQRLFQTYQKLMCVCCKSYSIVPTGTWAEIHTLFRYVIQHKLIDGPDGATPINTIGGLYKQMLLLWLVDPYRFTPDELEKIQDLINSYGMAAQFQPLGVVTSPAGFFLVRMDVDAPPAFLGKRPLDVLPSSAILLDTIDMAKLLQKAATAVEKKLATASDQNKALAWLTLLRRVTRQWSIASKRVFQRIRTHGPVQVTGGLRLTVFHLNGAQPLQQPVVLDLDLAADDDTVVITSRGPDTVTGIGRRNNPDDWIVINESPGGYALRLTSQQQGVYRIGDMVGVRALDSEEWMVGTIRWLQSVDDDEALEIGVQILAPTAQTAMLRPTITHSQASFQPALMLPEVPTLKQSPMIAAPRGTYTPNRELLVYTQEGEQLLRAIRLHEQTIGYELFEYAPSISLSPS